MFSDGQAVLHVSGVLLASLVSDSETDCNDFPQGKKDNMHRQSLAMVVETYDYYSMVSVVVLSFVDAKKFPLW